MNKIEIPLSKTKITIAICVSIIGLGISIWCVLNVKEISQSAYRFNNPIQIITAGITGIILTISALAFGLKKLFENNIGLKIDEFGIFDNTSYISVGLIKWEDIIEIQTKKISNNKIMIIIVKNPEIYIEKAKGIKKHLMKINFSMYNTPLAIGSVSLKCKYNEIEKLIQTEIDNYK